MLHAGMSRGLDKNLGLELPLTFHQSSDFDYGYLIKFMSLNMKTFQRTVNLNKRTVNLNKKDK